MKNTKLVRNLWKGVLALWLSGLCLIGTVSAATLLDMWDAAELGLQNGDPVASWTSQQGRVETPVLAAAAPSFVTGATPAGTPVVRFNNSLMRTSGTDNPAGGRSSFTLAYVFKANAAGAGGIAQWFNNTGIVDAEEAGTVADWGTAIDGGGNIALGIGNADLTTYNQGASLVDGNYHVVVAAWGPGGPANVGRLYVDGREVAILGRASSATRNAAPLAMGGLQTAANAMFNGDLAEVRFYEEGLSAAEAAQVMGELITKHGLTISVNPVITRQPVGKDLYAGRTLEVSAGVAGVALGYQWFKDGTEVVGATGPGYILPDAQTTDSGGYVLVVSNVLGGWATSTVAQVTVRPVVPLSDGLAGYWKLDETTGTTAVDSSGVGNNGTLVNDPGTQWGAGQVGGAMNFRGNGPNDYLSVPNFPMPSGNSFSMALWVWKDPGMPSDGWRMIYFQSLNGPFSVRNEPATPRVRPGVYQANGTLIAVADPQPLLDNTWTHFVFLADGSKLRVYRNGVEVANTGYDGTLKTASGATLTVGTLLNPALTANCWQGKMDDVAYWTRALTPTEVWMVYAAGVNTKSFPALNLAAGAYVTNWVAFNDHIPSDLTAPFVTAINMRGGPFATDPSMNYTNTGYLTNFVSMTDGYAAGQGLAATLTSSNVGTPAFPLNTGLANPDAGTPAYDLFLPGGQVIVDLANVGSSMLLTGPQAIGLTFGNLDPNMRYLLRGTAVRNGPTPVTHNYRWSLCSILDADAYVDADTAGALSAATDTEGLILPEGTGAYQSGLNSSGDMIGWDDVAPGANGSFTVLQKPYNGVVPVLGTAADNYGHAFAGIVLAEVGPLTPAVITGQPVSSNYVLETMPFTLNVVARGSSLSYQWYKGNALIPDATMPSFTVNPAVVADSGDYFCVVGNSFGSLTSKVAQVVAVMDTFPPRVVSVAQSTWKYLDIQVAYDEKVNADSATEPSNYTVSDAVGNPLTILGITQSVDMMSVTISLDPTTPLVHDASYTVKVSGVYDLVFNLIVDKTVPFKSWPLSLGYLRYDYFNNLSTSDNSLANTLLADPRYPNSPTAIYYMSSFNSRVIFPDDSHEGYGAHVTGYFIPKVDGNYIFYLLSDDSSQLFLNPNGEDPTGAVLITEETACCGPLAKLPSPPQALLAFHRYYIEANMKEGTGGDYLQVAVKLDTDSRDPNSLPFISGDFLATAVDPTVSATAPQITILTDPANVTAVQNHAATFAVAATNSTKTTQTYQWRVNGVEVLGANAAMFTIPKVDVSYTDAMVDVAVGVLGRNVFSAPARITYVPDTTSPMVVNVVGYPSYDPATVQVTLNRVLVEFDKFMDPATTGDSGTYSIVDGAGNPLAMTDVPTLVNNATATAVLLTTDLQTENTLYTVKVVGAQDEVGHPVTTNLQFRSWVSTPMSGVKFETFFVAGGMNELTNSPKFPCCPDFMTNLYAFDSRVAYPDDSHEQYGSRSRGVFIPPFTGNWVFFVRSDDPSKVFLNPLGPGAAGKIQVLEETGCCGEWDRFTSPAYPLIAGRPYYIEALHKEGGGGDYVKVAARLEGTGYPPLGVANLQVDPGSLAGPEIGYGYAPADAGGPLIITQQPADATIVENHAATFSVVVTNAADLPMYYQWFQNGNALVNGNGPTFTGIITMGDEGAEYTVEVYKAGSKVVSRTAVLHVIADFTPPTVLAVHGSYEMNTLTVKFSEIVDATTAQAIENYTMADFSISGAVLDASQTMVTLSISPLITPDTQYVLHVSGVKDASGNTLVATNSGFRSFILSRGFLVFEYFAIDEPTCTDYNISTLTTNPKYIANTPDLVRSIPAFNSRLVFPDDSHDHYGARISGYFEPPVSGYWQFYISQDDAGELWLNKTGMDPAGAEMIVAAPSCCQGFSAHGSAGIPLTAGQKYFIMGLYKEGCGGDYMQMIAKLTTDTSNVDALKPMNGTYFYSLADPMEAEVTITEQPADAEVVVRAARAPSTFYSADFSQGDAGFTVSTVAGTPPGPWHYNGGAGSWTNFGQDACGVPCASGLDTPPITLTEDGGVSVSFVHRYSFEDTWDGGQVMLSVNGGPYAAVTKDNFTANAYNKIASGNTVLFGQDVFTADSTGYAAQQFLTSEASLGYFSKGDTISLRFVAAWDECSQGSPPNWEIKSLQLSVGGKASPRATFSVKAVATTQGQSSLVTYQWQRNDGAGFTDIVGANASSYSLNADLPDGGAKFRCVVYGYGASATSDAATLTVTLPLTISYQNGSATIAWPAPGTGFVLQYSKEVPSTTWTTVPPASYQASQYLVYLTEPVGAENRFYRLIKQP